MSLLQWLNVILYMTNPCQDTVAQGWDMHFKHPMQLKDSDHNNKSAALNIKIAGRLDHSLVSTSAQQRHSWSSAGPSSSDNQTAHVLEVCWQLKSQIGRR